MDLIAYSGTGRLLLMTMAMLLMWSTGCSTAKIAGGSSPVAGIGARFEANSVAGSRRTREGGSFTPHFKVVRNGVARDSLVLEAPVTIWTTLEGARPKAVIECITTPVFNVGDGMQMEVSLIENGRSRMLLQRYYDAGRCLADRAWIPLRIPLDLQGPSGAARVEIRLSSGPQGNLVADWLALSDIHIVPGQEQP
jgi:hypothetical protein